MPLFMNQSKLMELQRIWVHQWQKRLQSFLLCLSSLTRLLYLLECNMLVHVTILRNCYHYHYQYYCLIFANLQQWYQLWHHLKEKLSPWTQEKEMFPALSLKTKTSLITEYRANLLGIFVGMARWLGSPDWQATEPLGY